MAIDIKKEIQKQFGERLRQLIEVKGLNITTLADALGKDRQDIQQIVNGKRNPTLFTIIQIANALEIPATELLQFKLAKQPY